MKKTLLTVAFVIVTFTCVAQEKGPLQNKGFQGQVEFGTRQVIEKGEFGAADIFNVFGGYRFDSGFFIGVGSGAEFNTRSELFIPIFFRAKYTFEKNWNGCVPFAAIQTGTKFLISSVFDDSDRTINTGIMGGVDFSSFSVFLGYSLASGMSITDSGRLILRQHHKQSEVFCIFAIRF
ncbi:MAG: hypothetical protein IJV32_07755 [Bacteroidales bacterium]|nr:hypothetical protein [Bacteroidales bacterium]